MNHLPPSLKLLEHAELRRIDLARTTRPHGFEAAHLPRSLSILLENVIANERLEQSARAFQEWLAAGRSRAEIAFRPCRILMQDTAGIAALADLAALRDAVAARGDDPSKIAPAVPIDLIIDHSLSVEAHARAGAAEENMRLEWMRNAERYRFFRWAEQSFERLRVIPPGNGICHQVNLESLARVAAPARHDPSLILSETLIGTDSHTTMVNALGVLGWGVGGIEAEAVALGESIMMTLPPVTRCELVGRRSPGVTATDIALAITSELRSHDVVGHFVEFCGAALRDLTLSDRATIANMAPEYGATCGLFPVDEVTLAYLRVTGRDAAQLQLVETYARASGLWRGEDGRRIYTRTIAIRLDELQPVLAGPGRPHDKVLLADVPGSLQQAFPKVKSLKNGLGMADGAVVLAAITSCTNTANPHLMMAAGLLARNANREGLKPKPWVKTSLAPGSRATADHLAEAGMQAELDALGFHLVGFGCATCVGNSGPLQPTAATLLAKNDIVTCAVLSGNRNFEGRIHPDVRANYLASPPLVVAYALAGNVLIDLTQQPLGLGASGRDVYLADIWPHQDEIDALVRSYVKPEHYRQRYAPSNLDSFGWNRSDAPTGATFPWSAGSVTVRRPPFFELPPPAPLSDIVGARALLVLGDGITTDHISPIGRILPGSPAAAFLETCGIERCDWGSYGERRGDHEVMWRGTFAHSNLRNALAAPIQGGVTRIDGAGAPVSVFGAATAYARRRTPSVVFAGRAYGAGSARDWAAKGTLLLGIRAVIAESFERIHRANLAGVGVLPLGLPAGLRVGDLGIDGSEAITILTSDITRPGETVSMRIERSDRPCLAVPLICRLETQAEIRILRLGGLFAAVASSAPAC